MVKHPCPHCGKSGISGIRRQFLGPAWPATCTECGGRIGVPGWSVLMSAPLIAAIALMPLVGDNGLYSFWLGVLGAAGMFLLWGGFVPLVKR